MEPSKYVLSTRPEETPINELISVALQRWCFGRDYQDLKQDFGPGTTRAEAGGGFITMPC